MAVELSGTTDFRILAVDQAGNESWSENYRVYVGAEGKKQRQEEDPKEIKTEVWGLNRAGAETEMEETGEIKTLIQRKRMELAAGTKISRGSQTLDEVEELCSGDGWYLKEAGASEKTGRRTRGRDRNFRFEKRSVDPGAPYDVDGSGFLGYPEISVNGFSEEIMV